MGCHLPTPVTVTTKCKKQIKKNRNIFDLHIQLGSHRGSYLHSSVCMYDKRNKRKKRKIQNNQGHGDRHGRKMWEIATA